MIGPLTAFIAMLEDPGFGGRDLSSLNKVASGGAPVNPATVERWERATGAYVHNTYGLTESAAPCHLLPAGARSPVDAESGALSIGVPICNTEAKIVDIEDGAELGPGEIVVRGPGVTSGYWRKPQESANALRGGWLHTGDVGKRDEAGWLYVVDRIKDMIVVSGVQGLETVRACVALRADAEASPEQLIEHCREALAVYKAPREVVLVKEIPKTLTGKALRRELRERG